MNAHHKPEAAPVLLRGDAGGIATLTLNRPQARNPLSEAMLAALSEVFIAIAADRSVKAVILTAAGPVFSAGHDLKEMTAHRADADRGRAYFTAVSYTHQDVYKRQVSMTCWPRMTACCPRACANWSTSFASNGRNSTRRSRR